jgi:hypothetical protein
MKSTAEFDAQYALGTLLQAVQVASQLRSYQVQLADGRMRQVSSTTSMSIHGMIHKCAP